MQRWPKLSSFICEIILYDYSFQNIYNGTMWLIYIIAPLQKIVKALAVAKKWCNSLKLNFEMSSLSNIFMKIACFSPIFFIKISFAKLSLLFFFLKRTCLTSRWTTGEWQMFQLAMGNLFRVFAGTPSMNSAGIFH